MSNDANDIDTSAFGLPTGVNSDPDVRGAGFMYAADDLAVDENDPIYQATVKAWRDQHGELPPTPGTEERPAEMRVDAEADDATDATDATDDDPSFEDALSDAASTPASTDAPPSDVTNDADDSPAPSDLAFNVDGQDFTLNSDQAEYLVRVNSWLEAIPQETKAQWSGIEQGTHVAITAEEYQRLQQAAQQPQQQRPPRAPDLDDLDADQIEYIRSLEARTTPADSAPSYDTPGQPQQPQQPQQQPQQPQQQPDSIEIAAAARHQAERQQQMMTELSTTNQTYQEKYQLSDEQMTRLSEVTARLQVIPQLTRQRTQYSPTGRVIHEAPFGQVVEQAYDIAMSQDPGLRQIRDDLVYNQRVAADAHRNAATNAKKAKAGTLASTPSAAVPANGKGPQISPDNKMDLQATSAAIADALSKMSEQS